MSELKTRIRGLDGLRAVCVALVFIEHFAWNGHGLGEFGVSMFFVLSGFLIIRILHRRRIAIEQGARLGAELKAFWIARVRRIFPIYYLVLFGLLAVSLATGHGVGFEGLPYYFAFVGNVYVQHVSHEWGRFTHLWSLSVEQHFYLLASPALLLIGHRHHVLVACGVLAAALFVFARDLANWQTVAMPYVPDLVNFAYMACGGLIALRQDTLKRGLARVWNDALLATAIAAFAVVNFSGVSGLSGIAGHAVTMACMIATCFGLVNHAVQFPNSLLVTVLETAPLRYLGTTSYGFYVYHYLMPHFARYTPRFAWLPGAEGVLIVLQFLATCLVAAVSWELFEKRFLTPRPQARVSASLASP